MGFKLKRREKGPPVDCVHERTCGATSIYGFEIWNRATNCIIVVCVDCARKMAEHPANADEFNNPHEFAEAVTKGGAP